MLGNIVGGEDGCRIRIPPSCSCIGDEYLQRNVHVFKKHLEHLTVFGQISESGLTSSMQGPSLISLCDWQCD